MPTQDNCSPPAVPPPPARAAGARFARRPLLTVLAAVQLFLLSLAAPAPADACPDCAMPEEQGVSLVTVRLASARQLAQNIGETLGGPGVDADPALVPELLGLRVPRDVAEAAFGACRVEFFYARTGTREGWVWRFQVEDEQARRRLYRALRHRYPGRHFRTDRNSIISAPHPDLMAGLPVEPDAEPTAGVTVEISPAALLAAFEEPVSAHVELMKERMAAALTELAGDIQHLEKQKLIAELDLLLWALRQFDRAEISADVKADRVEASVQLRAQPGSPLAALLASLPPGRTDLLERCPADAGAVFYTGLVRPTVQELMLRPLGLSSLADSPAAGHFLLALLPARNASAQVEGLLLASDGAALQSRWDALSRDGSAGMAISLRPLDADDETDVRLAVVSMADADGGGHGARFARWLFGEPLVAGLALEERFAAMALGPQPAKTLASLGRRRHAPLVSEAAFRETTDGFPAAPQVFLYVSPDAVSAWMALGGNPQEPPETGLAAAVALEGAERVHLVLRAPTTPLRPPEAGQTAPTDSAPPTAGAAAQ